jgi:hypothetical protein
MAIIRDMYVSAIFNQGKQKFRAVRLRESRHAECALSILAEDRRWNTVFEHGFYCCDITVLYG